MAYSKSDREFLLHYLWKYRRYVGVGLFALLVVDAMETLPPLFLKGVVDVVAEQKPIRFLGYFALAYLGTSLIQSICRYAWRMYLIRSSMFAGRDLRQKFAHHLFGLSASFFDRKPIGDLMSLATSDVEAVRMAIGTGVLVLADACFYFISVPIAMYLLSPRLTLLAFLPLPIIPWLVVRNQREIHSRYEKVQESFSGMSALVQEGLTGIRVIKGFAREDVQLKRLKAAGEEFSRLNLRLARVQSSFGPTLDLTMSLGMVGLLWFGGRSVGSAITLGTFVAFQRYVQKMVWPMASLGMAISFYQRALSSTQRLNGVFTERSDVADIQEPGVPRSGPKLPSDHAPGGQWRTAGRVEFRNLDFRFPGLDHDVLRGIQLTIEPGERVAFVGGIGSGKSALLSLLPRLYPVRDGALFLDGVDVNHWPLEELRKQVGYVGQDVFLFSETVSENVAFGLHAFASCAFQTDQIEAATQLAAVHEDVLGLTGSYGTRLGERGVNLSGGQKQRLTIARAIAKEPSVLVLDDALSSVDTRTEEKILKGLRHRARRNTEIIAAHRISTIRDADRIIVLADGKIVQQGKHAQLLTQAGGIYRSYYERQRLKEDLENYVQTLEPTEAPV